MDIAAVEMVRLYLGDVLGLGVVGRRQIGRAADRRRQRAVDDFEHLLRGAPRAGIGLLRRQLRLQFAERLAERCRDRAAHRRVEILRLVGRRLAPVPRLARGPVARADLAPRLQHAVFQREGFPRQAERLLGAGDLFGARRVGMRLLRAGAGRKAEADDRLAGDQDRLLALLRVVEGAEHFLRAMAVADRGLPLSRLEALDHVAGLGKRQRPVDRDVVVVPQDDEVLELQMAGEMDRLMADALHQVAVAGDDIGLVVDEVVAEARVQDALGQRHADRIGDALPKGPVVVSMPGIWPCSGWPAQGLSTWRKRLMASRLMPG